jgi:hypothetical protein
MASKIDPDLAKSLIREFQQQNATAGGPGLLTPDGAFINGFFIDRASLEAVLSDPNVAGISVLHAKDPEFAGQSINVFTLVFVGVTPNPDPLASKKLISSGNYYDKLPPCPPACADLQ